MRLRKHAARERLHRIRERAQSARTTLASAHEVHRLPLTRRASALCGTWADELPARRLHQRTSVQGQISMRRLGSFGFDIRVRDLSAIGCRVELIESVGAGDHVVARLPGLEPLGATVIWSDERCAGLQFNRPIHPAVLDLLLERLS
jgi:hypothetical protein